MELQEFNVQVVLNTFDLETQSYKSYETDIDVQAHDTSDLENIIKSYETIGLIIENLGLDEDMLEVTDVRILDVF